MALSHLAQVGTADRPARGHYQITDVGWSLLANNPGGITEKHLRALSGDPNAPHPWKRLPASDSQTEVAIDEKSALDRDEQIASGVARINDDIADQLLTRILDHEPVFFEQAVLELLMAME